MATNPFTGKTTTSSLPAPKTTTQSFAPKPNPFTGTTPYNPFTGTGTPYSETPSGSSGGSSSSQTGAWNAPPSQTPTQNKIFNPESNPFTGTQNRSLSTQFQNQNKQSFSGNLSQQTASKKTTDIKFKDVIGKSGAYYALPYAGQQASKVANYLSGGRLFSKKTAETPAPQWASNIITSAGPSLFFAPVLLTTTQFKTGLISSESIIPIRETKFVSQVKPIGENLYFIKTQSRTKLGGAVDYSGESQAFAMTNERFTGGVSKSVSRLNLQRGGSQLVATDKSIFSTRNVGNINDLTLTRSGSLTKQTGLYIENPKKYGYLGKALNFNGKVRADTMAGVTKPLGNDIYAFAGKGSNAQYSVGLIKVESRSFGSSGFSSVSTGRNLPTNVQTAIKSQVAFQGNKFDSLLNLKPTKIIPKTITSFYQVNKVKESTFQRSNSALLNLQGSLTKQKDFVVPRSVELSIPLSRTNERVKTSQLSVPRVLEIPKSEITPRLFSPLVPSKPFYPKTQIVPPFVMPKLGLFDYGRGRKNKQKGFKGRYAPNVAAIGLDITAFKIPKSYKMGLGALKLRPVIISRRRKKKR